MKKICIYAGSRTGKNKEYVKAARELGRLLARGGINVVFGGGKVGLMGVVADTVLAEGGTITGVIPKAMVPWEVAHAGCTKLIVVKTMHERKAKMHELSDGFIALPGGIGTLEELSEVLSWLSLGFHVKPVGLLNVGGYYDKLLAFLDHTVTDGFMAPKFQKMLRIGKTPEELLEKMMVL
ncbi:MAG: TIGR00730 family Rossman fold protein [Deltaproteobacteria bacterium]